MTSHMSKPVSRMSEGRRLSSRSLRIRLTASTRPRSGRMAPGAAMTRPCSGSTAVDTAASRTIAVARKRRLIERIITVNGYTSFVELDRNLVVKAEKWAIWLGLITVIFLLRHLFPIFFLTFVLTYIANTAVNALTKRFSRRKLNVLIVYLILLTLLAGVALLVVPRMVAEATN